MILETNTYSALQRSDKQVIQALRGASAIGLPFVTVAELQFGFLKGTQLIRNGLLLEQYLDLPFVSILFPTRQTCDLYGELELSARRQGRTLSNNDIWIAALALETYDTLLTYDQDFEVFAEQLGQQLQILYHE